MQRDKCTIGTDRLWAEGFVSSLMMLASLQGGGQREQYLDLALILSPDLLQGLPIVQTGLEAQGHGCP